MNLQKYSFPTKNGLLLSTEPFPNGNMLRSTAELMLLAGDKLSPDDHYKYRMGIEDCRHDLGNFSRYPDRKENTSVDDLLVIGTNSTNAKYILEQARSNFGCISVDGKWSFPQFIFRFQGMWTNLRMVASETLLFGRLIWALNLYIAAKEPIGNQDNWLLSHLMVITYERSGMKSLVCDLAIKYWRSKKTRPSADIMADYTGISDHPLVEAWKPYN